MGGQGCGAPKAVKQKAALPRCASIQTSSHPPDGCCSIRTLGVPLPPSRRQFHGFSATAQPCVLCSHSPLGTSPNAPLMVLRLTGWALGALLPRAPAEHAQSEETALKGPRGPSEQGQGRTARRGNPRRHLLCGPSPTPWGCSPRVWSSSLGGLLTSLPYPAWNF